MGRKNRGAGGKLFLVIVALLMGAGVYLYNSAMFERDVPKITLLNDQYWNGRVPLKIEISDDSGIMEYKVTLQSGNKERVLAEESLMAPIKLKSLELKVPSRSVAKSGNITVTIEARDASKWNFLAGNRAVSTTVLQIDSLRPKINIISNSYKIIKGGSALVVFSAKDENLKDLYIETSFNKRFKAKPFYREDHYIALIAWPVGATSFRASVIATDLAGNSVKTYIPLYLKERSYKVSKIRLSDSFLNDTVSDLAEQFGADPDSGVIEKFKFVNEDIRKQNEDLIRSITSKVSDSQIDSFTQKPFYPLKNGKVIASFGDHRLYYYKGKKISESYHLGLDLASVKMAKILVQNSAEVVFASENGIYGNMPILSHDLGLYTLYGHCSSVNVSDGDLVGDGEQIANTGVTGYAMGDHVHFGVLVQGVEVRPEEWMDKQWIRLNITDVIKEARDIIDRTK